MAADVQLPLVRLKIIFVEQAVISSNSKMKVYLRPEVSSVNVLVLSRTPVAYHADVLRLVQTQERLRGRLVLQ